MVRQPGQTLIFADTAMSKEEDIYIEYSFAEPPFTVYYGMELTSVFMSPSIHFRHCDKANIGWVDGHVDSQEILDLDEENAYHVLSREMKLGWLIRLDNSLFDLQ